VAAGVPERIADRRLTANFPSRKMPETCEA
jgi:hypothetical protein